MIDHEGYRPAHSRFGPIKYKILRKQPINLSKIYFDKNFTFHFATKNYKKYLK